MKIGLVNLEITGLQEIVKKERN